MPSLKILFIVFSPVQNITTYKVVFLYRLFQYSPPSYFGLPGCRFPSYFFTKIINLSLLPYYRFFFCCFYVLLVYYFYFYCYLYMLYIYTYAFKNFLQQNIFSNDLMLLHIRGTLCSTILYGELGTCMQFVSACVVKNQTFF
jgi:hypothetical protein